MNRGQLLSGTQLKLTDFYKITESDICVKVVMSWNWSKTAISLQHTANRNAIWPHNFLDF